MKFSIDGKNIRYKTGNEKITVQRFYSELYDWACEVRNMDKEVPAFAITPTMIQLNDGYNINRKLSNYLKSGSIRQNDNEFFYGIDVIGSVAKGTILDFVIYDSVVARRTINEPEEPSRNLLTSILVQSPINIPNPKIDIYARGDGITWSRFEHQLTFGITTVAIFTKEDVYYENETNPKTLHICSYCGQLQQLVKPFYCTQCGGPLKLE